MNRTLKYIGFLLGLLAIVAINACKDDIDPVIDELEFSRLFSPLNLEAKISNQTTVSINWDFNKGADSYVVEISDDSLQFSSIINTASVTYDELPYVYELPAGNSQYSVRVKAESSTVSESKWATLAFKSLPENLFDKYTSMLTGLGELTVNWKPGKAVTSLLFISETDEISVDISAEELAAGEKIVTDLPNADYEIRILNGSKSRGTQDFLVEGDVLLHSGEDLAAAIASAPAGDVILLEAEGMFGFAGDLTIEQGIKIRGLDGELPVVYATSGDRMFYIGSGISSTEAIVFENLYMSGYVNNNESEGQIRGVFDMESEACNIGAVKFIGCKLYNMGRQVMRLRGGSDQTIGEFVMDNCIVYDLGRSSGSYGVFCATETNTNARVVRISNSTIDNLVCHFIRYDDAVDCESILVENCTFNKTPFSSGRYLMDVRNAVITGGVEVSGCIFGNTSYGDDPSIVGIRTAEGVTLTITNSYATTDFVNTDYSIVNLLSPLGVSSTGLWEDPDNGDFSFSGAVVEAGDPRWITDL